MQEYARADCPWIAHEPADSARTWVGCARIAPGFRTNLGSVGRGCQAVRHPRRGLAWIARAPGSPTHPIARAPGLSDCANARRPVRLLESVRLLTQACFGCIGGPRCGGAATRKCTMILRDLQQIPHLRNQWVAVAWAATPSLFVLRDGRVVVDYDEDVGTLCARLEQRGLRSLEICFCPDPARQAA